MSSTGDLQTDACPQAPRNKKTEKPFPYVNPKVDIPENDIEEDVDEKIIEDETTEEIPKPNRSPRNGTRAKTHKTKMRNPGPCSYNILNVTHSNGIHFGNTYVYNGNKEEQTKTNSEVYKNDQIIKAMDTKDLVERQHITYVSLHVGEGWRNIGRLLDYSDGQIDQFYEDHHINGVKEVVYQLLLDWIRAQPKTATIGRLMNILWDCEQKDCVSRFADKYYKDVE